MSSAIILLSGGLDSYVSLDIAYKKFDKILALTFNYGQKVFEEELLASKLMCEKYNLEQKVINLDFLSEMINKNDIWVPNRNGLFLNIAGCYADKYGFEYIIIGANKEEASEFPDNTEEFLLITDKYFEYSTIKHPKIFAPLKDKTKVDIVNIAINNNLDFNLIKSCYESIMETDKKHCGKCKSCLFLKNAIEKSCNKNLLKIFF